jgi:hypothetical protein
LQAIHKNDNKFVSHYHLFSQITILFLLSLFFSYTVFYINRFYVVNPKADKNACVAALDELISTPFDALRQKRFTFERVRNFTQQHLVVKTDDSSKDTGKI